MNTVKWTVDPDGLDNLFKSLWVESPSKAISIALSDLQGLDKKTILKWLTGEMKVVEKSNGDLQLATIEGKGVSIEENLESFSKQYIECAEAIIVYKKMADGDGNVYDEYLETYIPKREKLKQEVKFLLGLLGREGEFEAIQNKIHSYYEQVKIEQFKSLRAEYIRKYKKDKFDDVANGFIDPDGNIWGVGENHHYYFFIHRDIFNDLQEIKIADFSWVDTFENGWITIRNKQITFPAVEYVTDKQLEILLASDAEEIVVETWGDGGMDKKMAKEVLLDVLSGEVSRDVLFTENFYLREKWNQAT